MARKNSVLAPFEHVTWDQWQYFTLHNDEENDNSLPVKTVWHDPRDPYRSAARTSPSTATGPTGEHLYAIHLAPGVKRRNSPEDECLRWLLQLLRDYPERPPQPLPNLAKEAVSKFPGLSERGFRHCRLSAQTETGNWNWSRPGAPSKSPQKSSHKK